MLKKKIWTNFQRIIELFTQKIVTKLSKIWVWDPGSRKNLFRIPNPGSKKHRIPDPNPQYCLLGSSACQLLRRAFHSAHQFFGGISLLWSPVFPGIYSCFIRFSQNLFYILPLYSSVQFRGPSEEVLCLLSSLLVHATQTQHAVWHVKYATWTLHIHYTLSMRSISGTL